MNSIVLMTTCVLGAFMFQTASAILPAAGLVAPVVPPVVPPMLGALPFAGLGLPLLGLGFPFLGPFGLGGLAFSRLALLGLLGRKKRDVTDVTQFNIGTLTQSPVEDELTCTITANTKQIACIPGAGQRIVCEIEPRLSTIADIRFNLTDLAVSERVTEQNGEIFNLISPRSAMHRLHHGPGFVGFLNAETLAAGKFTFIHPATLEPVLLSFYFDVTLDQPGFVATDKTCYSAIADVIRENWSTIRFNLFV